MHPRTNESILLSSQARAKTIFILISDAMREIANEEYEWLAHDIVDRVLRGIGLPTCMTRPM